MTNEICPHCQLPRQGAHSCMDSMRAEITQLRGNLSLAEEGLANATQEIANLTAALSEARQMNYESEVAGVVEANKQLHSALKTAQELAAARLIVIERLHELIDSRDRALGFVPLDESPFNRQSRISQLNSEIVEHLREDDEPEKPKRELAFERWWKANSSDRPPTDIERSMWLAGYWKAQIDANEEITRLRNDIQELTCGDPTLVSGSHEPLPVASRDADHCDYPDCEQHWTHVVAQARALLEPLADCDPAIRQWLKTPDLPKLPGASRDASSGLLANHCSCGSCVWGLSATASMTSADGSVHRFNKPCTLRTSE